MSGQNYMPLFVGDYRADTIGLTTEEHGAYLLLIMAYWSRGGPIPNDKKFLCQATHTHPNRWGYVAPQVLKFFKEQGGNLYHERVEKELLRSRERSASAKRSQSYRSSTRPDHKEDSKKEDYPSGLEVVVDNTTTKYAFESGIIKLLPRDLDRWQKSFTHLNVMAELEGLAHWAGQQVEQGHNWFHAVAGALAKREREVIAAKVARTERPKPRFYKP